MASFFSLELKHLFVIAAILTISSLFVAHNTNPYHIISSMTPSNTNTIFSTSPKSDTNIHHTSPECQAADTKKYNDLTRKLSTQPSSKYAYIHVIDLNLDITFQTYGILSFQGGLLRTQSNQDHIVMFPRHNEQSIVHKQ